MPTLLVISATIILTLTSLAWPAKTPANYVVKLELFFLSVIGSLVSLWLTHDP